MKRANKSCRATVPRLGQREYYDLFTGDRADVVMQAHDFHARGLLDHLLHECPRRFDQVDSHLFEKVSSLVGRKRADELLFCYGQHPRESDHEKIADQVGVDSLRSSAHVVLFELADSFTDGCFDFALCLHRQLGV